MGYSTGEFIWNSRDKTNSDNIIVEGGSLTNLPIRPIFCGVREPTKQVSCGSWKPSHISRRTEYKKLKRAFSTDYSSSQYSSARDGFLVNVMHFIFYPFSAGRKRGAFLIACLGLSVSKSVCLSSSRYSNLPTEDSISPFFQLTKKKDPKKCRKSQRVWNVASGDLILPTEGLFY